mmetsp:Transcript_74608/g.222534  ORF Transcript_74608/g.222534 Transcript_74608/m.222534 type:complete len:1122 (-) Transcript_74608:212-3577(-)
MCPRTPADAEQQAVAKEAALLEVVGGGGKGGILVRTGRETSSEELPERLSTGSIVRALESDRGRIYYEMVRGFGPLRGWVSTHVQDKVLLAECGKAGDVQSAEQEEEVKAKMALQMYGDMVACEEVEESQGLRQKQAFPWVSAPVKSSAVVRAELAKELEPEKAAEKSPAVEEGSEKKDLKATFGYPAGTSKDACFARFDVRDDACRRFSGFKHGQVVLDPEGREFVAVGVKCLDGTPRLFFQPTGLGRAGAGSFPDASARELRALLSPAAGEASRRRLQQAVLKDFDDVEDSDEEVVTLCRQCRLPLGSFVYVERDGEGERHGECMARLMLQQMQEEEEARRERERAQKAEARAKHDIGWRADRIPRNESHMNTLGCRQPMQGLCCLILAEQEEEATVSVSETLEPAGSVNLEYLSIALQCRIREGAEPAFSLDPTSMANDPGQTMQQKRFEPAWLAGTSVGDVLFQSDYLLKELSMGEYDQPVIGMKSCFDFSEEEGHNTEWRAREWFVVRNAGISLSEDGMLIPHVEMAIEAREQINGAEGIEDSPITRPTHPLAKYADAFTHNFELIAERRSAVYHLRELAKASVLAKFLVEGGIRLQDAWLRLGAQPRPAGVPAVIPQLWNDRCHSQVSVRDGRILEAEAGPGSKRHSVYGGVEFGLDRFSISRPSLASGAMLARGATAQMSRVLGVSSVRQLGPPLAGQPLRAGIEAQAHLQGVDLSLSKFDLSTAARERDGGPAGGWGRVRRAPSAPGAAAGEAFWADVAATGPEAPFGEEDGALLRAIFNPFLSDRRGDGDKFVPPSTSFRHVQNLRELVEGEAKTRQSRREHFFSKDFLVGDAGPLFPSSWTSSFEIARGQVLQRVPGGAHVPPEHYRPYTGALPPSARGYGSTPPVFDRSTEDGTRFRIYRCGGLEVRTTQDHGAEEAVGAVFAVSASTQASMDGDQRPLVREDERVVKVAEYVESAASDLRPLARNSYVVVETAEGNSLVTEMLENGSVLLEVNPEALPDRNSRARVVRSADCGSVGVSVQEVNACKAKGLPSGSCRASVADRKHYAQVVFGCAKGNPNHIDSGFSTRTAKTWSELKETLGLTKTQLADHFPGGGAKSRKGTAFGGVLRL